MSQEAKMIVTVGGIYNWPESISKEQRHRDKTYPKYNWCDIDVVNIENHNAVLDVFKKYSVSCISQRCGKGRHFFGDLVPDQTWIKIWSEIKPYADPLWQPHTLRVTKKRVDEIWERPVFHDNGNNNIIKPWMKSVMSFLNKSLKKDNSNDIYSAMHHSGLDKYFQCTTYRVEIKL